MDLMDFKEANSCLKKPNFGAQLMPGVDLFELSPALDLLF